MDDETIILGFTGDLCAATTKTLNKTQTTEITNTFKKLNNSVNFTVTNFESTICPNNKATKKIISLKSQCEFIKESGFNLFCLANNHILDEGEKGLEETKNWLQQAGLFTVGAGKNISEAKRPYIININKKRIAFINATDATHYQAKKNLPGVSPLKKKHIINSVKEIRAIVDLVVVILHSDLEFSKSPSPWRVRLSRKLIDAGSDIVIHHHPHVLQGIESYKGGVIAYSLGNFLFPVFGNPYMKEREGNTDRSIYLKIHVNFSTKKSISYELLPIIIDKNNIPKIANKLEEREIFLDIKIRSNMLNNHRLLRSVYFKKCKENFNKLIVGSYYEFKKNGLIKSFNYIKIHLKTDMHRRWIFGFFTMGNF